MLDERTVAAATRERRPGPTEPSAADPGAPFADRARPPADRRRDTLRRRLAGRLAVRVDPVELHEPGVGDVVTFPSSRSHRCAAPGPDETRVRRVNIPPTP